MENLPTQNFLMLQRLLCCALSLWGLSSRRTGGRYPTGAKTAFSCFEGTVLAGRAYFGIAQSNKG